MIEQILASLGEYWLTLVAILLLICASAFSGWGALHRGGEQQKKKKTRMKVS